MDTYAIIVSWSQDETELDLWDCGDKENMEKEFEKYVIEGGPDNEVASFYLVRVWKEATMIKNRIKVVDNGDE